MPVVEAHGLHRFSYMQAFLWFSTHHAETGHLSRNPPHSNTGRVGLDALPTQTIAAVIAGRVIRIIGMGRVHVSNV